MRISAEMAELVEKLSQARMRLYEIAFSSDDPQHKENARFAINTMTDVSSTLLTLENRVSDLEKRK